VAEVAAAIGADELEVSTGITGAVIGGETFGNAMLPDGYHQLFHQYFAIFGQKETGPNHIAAGIITNGVQIGFAFEALDPDFGAMEKICHPELTEFLVGKGASGYVLHQVRITMHIGGRRQALLSGMLS
jgi:hypothetical protein